jgi:hypothetical protein
MKAEENKQASENGNIIRAAVSEADAATAAISIDPREAVQAARARIAGMTFPTLLREQQAAREVVLRSKSIDELIRNAADLSTIRRAVAEMEEACQRLTVPEKMPSFEEERRRMQPVLRRASWSPEEIDALGRLYGSGGRINTVSITSVKVGDREILRSDIRKQLEPGAAQESERREHEALQLEAENKERRAHGQEPINREW